VVKLREIFTFAYSVKFMSKKIFLCVIFDYGGG
jgi:hypothetical protein